MAQPSCGLLPGASLAGALSVALKHRQEHWFVIRCIDSTRDTDGLLDIFRYHDLSCEVISSNVCLSIEMLEKALEHELFTGFDEVWLFAGPPPGQDLATLPRATSDGADFSERLPEELTEAMDATRCILILGDGCGLNYATTDTRLAEGLAAM